MTVGDSDVTLPDGRDLDEAIADLDIPAEVSVVEGDPVEPSNWFQPGRLPKLSRIGDRRKWDSGGHFARQWGGESINNCTSNATLKRSGRYYMLTAAHCVYGRPDAPAKWAQGDLFAYTASARKVVIANMKGAVVKSKRLDAAIIRLRGEGLKSNKIFRGRGAVDTVRKAWPPKVGSTYRVLPLLVVSQRRCVCGTREPRRTA